MLSLLRTVCFYFSYFPRLFFTIRKIHVELNKIFNDDNIPREAKTKLNHPKVRHRVTQYALIHVVLNESIARYFGRTLSKEEFTATINACASGPFFDDFFDEYNYSETEIYELLKENPSANSPENTISNSNASSLHSGKLTYQYLLNVVYKNTEDKQRFYSYFHLLYTSQWESKKLNNPDITREVATVISKEKGGYSALVFRSLIRDSFSPEESKMLYQLGVVGQFIDDIFDLYDDYHKGLITLSNNFETDFNPVVKAFHEEIKILHDLIQRLNIPEKRKRNFKLEINLIIAAGQLACDHFLSVQASQNGQIKLETIERKLMIIDMEKWTNQLKMLKIAVSSKFHQF